MISTGELRKGVAIELDGELWQILDYHHIKMGRGSAQVRITLRNIKRGQTVERTFQAGDEVAAGVDGEAAGPVPVPRRRRLPLHGQRHLRPVRADAPTQLGDALSYLKDGMTLDRTSYQGETIGVELPITVDLARRRDRAGLRRRHASPARASRPRPRPASSSRCRSSSNRATPSASTPGPGNTRPGSDPQLGENVNSVTAAATTTEAGR